jgi:hypothetical protein
MQEYYNNLSRVQEIINYLNNNSKNTILPGAPSFIQILQTHKIYIHPNNPLQILVSEGMFLLRLLNKYEQDNYEKLRG